MQCAWCTWMDVCLFIVNASMVVIMIQHATNACDCMRPCLMKCMLRAHAMLGLHAAACAVTVLASVWWEGKACMWICAYSMHANPAWSTFKGRATEVECFFNMVEYCTRQHACAASISPCSLPSRSSLSSPFLTMQAQPWAFVAQAGSW